MFMITELKGHVGPVWYAAWHPKTPLLATAGQDHQVRLWGPDASGEWSCVGELDQEQHARTIRTLAWSPDGGQLAAGSFDATTSLWEWRPSAEGQRMICATTVEGHENEVKSVDFSHDGQYLATCSRDRSVWIYERVDDEYDCVGVLQSHTQDVKAVAWHPRDDVVMSCSYDDTIKVWGPDGDDWSCMHTLTGHKSTVWGLSFRGDGQQFASCSDDRTVRIWQLGARKKLSLGLWYVPIRFRGYEPPQHIGVNTATAPWECVAVIEGEHDRTIYSVAWRPGADMIATASGDNHVRIFQQKGYEWVLKEKFRVGEEDVNCVAWNPSGTHLACTTDSGSSFIFKCD